MRTIFNKTAEYAKRLRKEIEAARRVLYQWGRRDRTGIDIIIKMVAAK